MNLDMTIRNERANFRIWMCISDLTWLAVGFCRKIISIRGRRQEKTGGEPKQYHHTATLIRRG